MKKICFISFSLCLLVILSFLCIASVSAESTIQEGKCGDQVRWSLNTVTGEMVITGTGPMYDYAPSKVSPWLKYKSSIQTVTIAEGVTTMGAYSFQHCGNLKTVYLPSSITAVGDNVFSNATPEKVRFEGSAEAWSQVAVGAGNEILNDILVFHPGHNFTQEVTDPIYLASDATCTQGALYYTSCVCGEAGTDTFAVGEPTGHVKGEAICNEQQICIVCQAVLVEKVAHNYTSTVTEPTCTEEGYTTHTCIACGDTYKDSITPIVGRHTPGAAATCTTAQTCTACGEILADKLDHDYRSTIVAGTCTEGGYTSHECALCHDTYRDSYTPVQAHTPGAAATCTAPQTCTVCHAIITPVISHDYKETVTRPTCTEEGYTSHTCSVCQTVYVDSITPAIGHTPGDEASCHAPQVCTVCNSLLVSRLEHVMEETIQEATCATDGQVLNTCTLCGYSVIQSYIDAIGHEAGDWEVVREADIGISGRVQKSCNTCGEVLEAETFWLGQNPLPNDPDDTSTQKPSDPYAPVIEETGCRFAVGNVFVILIVLAAAFLLWFVEIKRR